MKKLIQKFQLTSTSKQLTWVLVNFYILSIILVGLVHIIFNLNLSYLLNYESPIIIVVIGFYFNKAKHENLANINNSTTSTQDTTQQ